MSTPHTYKKTDLVGSSTIGTDDGIQNAIAKATKSIKHMD